MTPAGSMESEMPRAEAALDQTMTDFQSKGSFPKRGTSLKPTISADIAMQRVERENAAAEAYHFGGAKLTDGLPLPRSISKDSGSDGTDGMSFAAFDDMLATATVGGEKSRA